MAAALNLLHDTSEPMDRPDKTGLLVGASNEEVAALNEHLAKLNWELRLASTESAALNHLQRAPFSVVICNCDLDWKNMLNAMLTLENPPTLIVSSATADNRLWAEVFNVGGFDVLLRPYRSDEVAALLEAAVRSRGHVSVSKATAAGAN